MNQFAQIDLVVSVLAELERQQPGVSLTQLQFNEIVAAADLIVDAMSVPFVQQNRAA